MEYQFFAIQDSNGKFASSFQTNRQWNERPQGRFATLDAAYNKWSFTGSEIQEHHPKVVRCQAVETFRFAPSEMPDKLTNPLTEVVLMDTVTNKFFDSKKGFSTMSYLKATKITTEKSIRKVVGSALHKDVVCIMFDIRVLESL